jgi:hypothetical protein
MTYSIVPVEWSDIGDEAIEGNANRTRMVNLNLLGQFQDCGDPVSYPNFYAKILKGLVTF